MPVSVDKTLELMAGIYRLSSAGGPDSDRFQTYVEAARAGHPVHAYNPMTSKPVGPVLDRLIAAGAEDLLAAVEVEIEGSMFLSVAAEGAWTERLSTDVEHRLLAQHPRNVLLWWDDPLEEQWLRGEIAAQASRLRSVQRFGVPITLADAVRQEGAAGRAAGAAGTIDPQAEEALAILGDEQGLATMVAFLYGDDAATRLGFTPLGLGTNVGLEHARAIGSEG